MGSPGEGLEIYKGLELEGLGLEGFRVSGFREILRRPNSKMYGLRGPGSWLYGS